MVPSLSRAVARVSVERSRSGVSVAREVYAETPIRLLRPRNGGHAVWIFSTILGPGMMGGDALDFEVTVGAGASCYAGAIGVARAFAGASRVRQRLRVEEGGLLVWAPDPVACGRGADLEAEVAVEVAPGGSLLLVDAVTSGRPALGERWCFERLRSTLGVKVGGRELLREQLDLRPGVVPLAAHLGDTEAFALLLAVGPRVEKVRASWLEARPAPGPELVQHGAPLGQEGAVLRLASDRASTLQRAAMISLGNLGETLGDDPRACRF
ncbi:MAG: urease accessory protein UreD [Polyangiaceae bacterium]|nr:urease accessory protein UreD [Polyangiaceae bacterium]